MKKKKLWKIAIPAAALAAVIAIVTVNNANKAGEAMARAMEVEAITVEKGNVSETIETNGTVVSGEQKTIFSPVNAQVETAPFQPGDLVKEGQKLVTFNLKDLESQNQKAELTVKANQLGYQDTVNKSNQAAVKQAEAKAQAASLQAQVDAKKQEVANLSASISNEAKAQAEAKQQELAQINAQIGQLEKELKEAQKALEAAKTQKGQAEVTQQKAQVDFEAAAASEDPEKLEAARNALNAANETLAAANGELEETQELVNSLNAQIAALQPTGGAIQDGGMSSGELQQKLEAAQAELAELKARLEGQNSIAQADAGTLSSAARAQMQTNNNLAELESY